LLDFGLRTLDQRKLTEQGVRELGPSVSVARGPGGKVLSLIGREATRVSYEVKSLVAMYPWPALVAARWRGRGAVLTKETDLLIEGYPRSGNNFAVEAFQRSQPQALRVAHHVHAPAHVLAAIRSSIPAIVLIREPQDAILSFVIRNPYISIRQAIRGYVRFYEPLLPYRDGFVVGPFPEVTSDFGRVIRRANNRFGTSFHEFEHTEENVRACFEAIDRHYRVNVGTGPEVERMVARPSEARERLKDMLRTDYRNTRLQGLREKAQAMYELFAGAGKPVREQR